MRVSITVIKEALAVASVALLLLLVGDLNSSRGSPPVELLGEYWAIPGKVGPPQTFPSGNPTSEIDYILYRPAERFEIVEYYVADVPIVSDHLPVVAELVIRPLP